MNGFTLEGKRIVVTGASQGIGRAAAEIVGGLGAKVLLVARNEAAMHETAAAIQKAGGEAVVFGADLSAIEGVNAFVDRAHALWGGVDGLFANAGIVGPVAPFSEFPLDGFDQAMNVNVRSTFWAMRLVLPGMMERRSGAIVATGSIASERGLPMTSAYNASKHAVLGLVRSAAAEVARHNIRVNCVVPGFIRTQMLEGIAGHLAGGDVEKGMEGLSTTPPQARVGRPEEVGAVVAFLLSDAASYVNGQAWGIDGGMLGTMANGG